MIFKQCFSVFVTLTEYIRSITLQARFRGLQMHSFWMKFKVLRNFTIRILSCGWISLVQIKPSGQLCGLLALKAFSSLPSYKMSPLKDAMSNLRRTNTSRVDECFYFIPVDRFRCIFRVNVDTCTVVSFVHT